MKNNITCRFLKRVTNEDGNTELTLVVDNYINQELVKRLVPNKEYRLQFTEIKSTRSLEQNKLLWSLIHEIALARGGERASEDDFDIYLEALERAGVKYEYIAVLPQAESLLKEQFRAIKKTNSFIYKNRQFNSYKVYYGSSTMNSKEMALLLQTVLDMASEAGLAIDNTF